MKYCKKCVMPDTKPDLTFDDEGMCDACRSQDKKDEEIDWAKREAELKEILERYKNKDGSNYDCIIPVSGGKDSTYQAWIMKEKYGMNPLCVTFEPTQMTPLGKENLENLRKIGLDLISIEKNPNVYKSMGRECFRRVGDHEWPNHVGIFTTPVRIAVSMKIPLIIWGENSQQEYGGPAASRDSKHLNRRWLEEFGGLLGNRVEDMIGVDGITQKDLVLYTYPTDEELQVSGTSGLFLGYYYKWNAKTQVDEILKIGFKVKADGPVEGTYLDYENLDCNLVSIHDYMKYVKFGFGRATDHACLDLRHGRMGRDEALRTIDKYDGKISEQKIKDFCEFYEMSREEFFKIVDSFTNKAIFKTDDEGHVVRDENGQLINLMLKKEMERCGLKA